LSTERVLCLQPKQQNGSGRKGESFEETQKDLPPIVEPNLHP
jgi:hypothetical protein